MPKQKLMVVAGPTASGKTALAVAVAKRVDGEVISADSMQVYEEARIGTARPTPAEMDGVPHHLLGFVPLSRPYSVAQYAADAHAAIADVAARGKQPILCGGTGLYIQAVLQNLTFSPEDGHAACRAQLRQEAETLGGAAMLARLRAIDPDTADRLHEHDIGRIVRALEVYETTGRTMSEQRTLSREHPSPYDVRMAVLDFRERQTLYDRIDRRVDAMMQDGLLSEARALLQTEAAPTAMQAIGYKELAGAVRGEEPSEVAVARLKQSTRRYAKRQLSWFRHQPDARFFYVDDYADPDALSAAVTDYLTDE
ncbi:MAG: tRNA (adenosine(37)-N6)-dimethylallyltransferase MiaA [Clostridia bacterium]|nr:tRNA (adenosine(37)-N6)-dimethylallyltransferase MiaA [Clostridia bacterium]